MIFLIATGSAAALVFALALLTPAPPLWRLLAGVAVAGVVGPTLGLRGALAAFTGLAAGFFAVLAVMLIEVLVVASDSLRAAMVRGSRR